MASRLLGVGKIRAAAGAVAAGAFGAWNALPTSTEAKVAPTEHHHILVIGGGAAGLTVASQIMNKLGGPTAGVAIVEPSDWHYYQPYWTMAGGGIVDVELSRRPMKSVMPKQATWLKTTAANFEPEKNAVVLGDGRRVQYDYLIVASGIQVDLGLTKGLTETMGKNGVSTIYDFRYAGDVWKDIEALHEGVAIFTQPSTGVKCGGAPQKIMWLAEDWWRSKALCRQKVKVEFITGTKGMFGVPKYAAKLEQMRQERGVEALFQHDLVEVDGPNKTAYFQTPDGKRVAKKYDMLHVTPRMGPHDYIKQSTLAEKGTGYVEVDKETLQHVRYPNVFAIGDCANLPTSKTAAAVTAQAPVVVHNLRKLIEGKPLTAKYDGYTSCPILTNYGKLLLAEFRYGGAIDETFSSIYDQGKENLFFYLLKTQLFPWAYWNLMLSGRWYGTRTIFEPKFAD